MICSGPRPASLPAGAAQRRDHDRRAPMTELDEKRGDGSARAPAPRHVRPDQAVHRDAGARPRRLRRPPRRSACAARPERRRQIDAHQDPGRRLPGRCRRDPLRGRAVDLGDRHAADRLHPSGPRPRRMDDGRRERRAADRLSALALGLISWRQVRKAAADALAIMGSDLDPDAPVTSLPAAERSLVAIGRALAVKADILVLDEPTAALPDADVERLLETLRRLRASGIGIVYVTHRLDEVFRIADRITVLRDGRRVATVDSRRDLARRSRRDDRRPLDERRLRQAGAADGPRRARGRERGRRATSDPSRSRSRPARRSGWSGLRGAGHHTIGRAIFGQVPLDRGPRLARRAAHRSDRPRRCHAQRDRLRLEPPRRGEHRREHGGAREHLHEPGRDRERRDRQIVSRRGERADARAALKRFSIKAEDTEQAVATLSGGNQQKVVVARWMEAKVRPARARGADHRRRRRARRRRSITCCSSRCRRGWRCS